MPNQPFNKLSPKQVEQLSVLIEEASEVAKAATKILRHGYASVNPDRPYGPDNRHSLMEELGDFQNAVGRLAESQEIFPHLINERAVFKANQGQHFLHHHKDNS